MTSTGGTVAAEQEEEAIVAADVELTLEELAALDHAVALLDGVGSGLMAAGKGFAAEEVYVTRDVLRGLLERDHEAREGPRYIAGFRLARPARPLGYPLAPPRPD